jgi:putative spermidine/putrescine transport system ATP-binding protein
MTLLRLEEITKVFGEVKALNDLSLSVETGQFYGLLGPSGCGKTTTLRTIAGLETPDHGFVEFQGRRITNLRPEKRGFGFVFQNYALFPHLSVFENVAFGLKARSLANGDVAVKVSQALELVQLPGYQSRMIHELSGGQQQRVAIARAISIEPALLLFDEPLSNLDVALRESTRGELRELIARLGLTAIYVTHDQDDAFALCDRISVMTEGRIVQTGTPRELYEKPETLQVARFLGRNNLIRAMRLSAMKDEAGMFKSIVGGHALQVPINQRPLAALDKPCTLAIRPEHVSLSRDTRPGSLAPNSIHGLVREMRFAGSAFHATVAANGLVLEALLLHHDGFSEGDKCIISLPPEHIIPLAE